MQRLASIELGTERERYELETNHSSDLLWGKDLVLRLPYMRKSERDTMTSLGETKKKIQDTRSISSLASYNPLRV